MNPWEIVAEEDKTILGARIRLVLLRCPQLLEPYRVYALNRSGGYWDLVDRFSLPETNGTETPDWALRRAWARVMQQDSPSVLHGNMEKA